jgi:hypothetical protein
MDITVFGGPSYFKFRQDVLETFQPIEAYPFDTLQGVDVTSGTLRGSALGFHVGVDATRYLNRHIGLGGLVRFSRANKTLSIGAGDPFGLPLGSVQIGGGARFRF